MTEFKMQLTETEVNRFLEQICVGKNTPSAAFLKEIVSGIVEHVPFQNITMLTGPRHRPSENWIKNEMLNGLGGLCTVRNPFLFSLLEALGFEVRFVSSTILEPDCHISLIVTVDNAEWWVDVGNGYPYFSPVRLGDDSPQTNWFFRYRLVQNGSRFEVLHALHEGDWSVNHHFSPEGVEFSVFDRMHEMHYTQPGWGPFLTGLRVNRFWSAGGVVLKDHRASSPDGEETLHHPNEVHNWLKQWFEPSFWDHINVDLAFERWKKPMEAMK